MTTKNNAAPSGLTPCAECGMPCEPAEYHPYTACLLFKQTRDAKATRDALNAVYDHARERLAAPKAAEQAGQRPVSITCTGSLDDVKPFVDEWIRQRETCMDGTSYVAALQLAAYIKECVAPLPRASDAVAIDAAEFAQLQTFLTEHHSDVRPSHPAGLAAWALAALDFERSEAAQPDERAACAHDYVRTDGICTECGERKPDERAADPQAVTLTRKQIYSVWDSCDGSISDFARALLAAHPAERAAFEWPAHPQFPSPTIRHANGSGYFTEHQMRGYANEYGELVRATAPQATVMGGEPCGHDYTRSDGVCTECGSVTPIKDHEIAEVVNRLRDTAKAWGKTQQLRERIAAIVVPALRRAAVPQAGALTDEQVNAIMEQAQVFASAWSLVGGRFDFGNALQDAEEAKAELRTMLARAGGSDAR